VPFGKPRRTRCDTAKHHRWKIMRDAKALAILLVCLMLTGLPIQQFSQLDALLIVGGVAADFALAARQLRKSWARPAILYIHTVSGR